MCEQNVEFKPNIDDIYIEGDRRPMMAREVFEGGWEQTNTVKIHDTFVSSCSQLDEADLSRASGELYGPRVEGYVVEYEMSPAFGGMSLN